jgi:hypothetical protein
MRSAGQCVGQEAVVGIGPQQPVQLLQPRPVADDQQPLALAKRLLCQPDGNLVRRRPGAMVEANVGFQRISP